ncbi:response regulator transcription factor [Clostridium sp. UBA6640]|uniref:response regulator transcription factor n=1 Tax=Clostridium sp. UBA6640 TaxID=1946370 RepID=UPI0025C5AB31|nr:response regulator transcription factor [Clostridium sp. UBA6640]
MKKILIVEDDAHISDMLQDLLTQGGYVTNVAYSGTEALMCFRLEKYELILLDLMLPGKTGYEVLTEIKAESKIPIIVLTAIDTKESTVSLLKLGANDYITKPFDNEELLARIEVQLRNIVTTSPDTLHFKNITLDLEQFDASVNQEPLNLSKREFEILKCLMENPKKVFTKNNLYKSVWGEEFFGDDNTINVYISKIRTKLAKIESKKEYIQTVWGIGFKMQE